MGFFGPSDEELDQQSEFYHGKSVESQKGKKLAESLGESAPISSEDSSQPSKPVVDLRQANLDLASKIIGRVAKAKDIPQDKIQKGLDLSRDLLKSSETTVNTYEDNIAKNMFKEKFLRDANADDLSIFKQAHNQQIQDSLYDNLQENAKTLGIDVTNDKDYQNWVARSVTRNTPKQATDESWGHKVADVAKGLAGTVVGTGAIISDGLGITNNAYKDYFGDMTELKGNEGAGTKAWDLLWKQGAWMDIGFAAATVLTGGLAAPEWISAKTAAGVGLRTVGKFAVKEILKDGAEGVGKAFLKEGAEFSEKEIIEGLTKTVTEDVAKSGIKGATEETIQKATHSILTGEGLIDLAKTKGSKELTDAITTSLTKNVGANLGEKASKNFAKQVAKFGGMTQTISDIGNLTTKGKTILALSNIADALGVPGLQQITLAPLGGKLIDKAAGKGIGGYLAKEGLHIDTTLPRVMIHGGIPFLGTLPGVGNFIADNFMMAGTTAAGAIAKATRIGIVDKQKQEFIAKYGIDPDTSDNIGIKKAFEEQVNFAIRNALPSQILTGVSYNERGLFGQAASSVVDGLLNMSGILIGSKFLGKGMGFVEDKLAPYAIDKEGNYVSQIKGIAEFQDILAKSKLPDNHPDKIDQATLASKIEDLKTRIENQDPSVITTIRSLQDFEKTRAELAELTSDPAGKMNSVDSAFNEALAQVKNLGDINSVLELQKQHTEIGAQMFSQDRLKELQTKQDLLTAYLKKQAESTSFFTQVTRPIIDNIFTVDRLSPAHALMYYNKFNAANEDALSHMNAYHKSMFDPVYDIATYFSQKGELLKNPEIQNSALKEKVRTSLSSQGANDTQIEAIWKPLAQELQLATTRVYLNLPDVSLQQVFAKVFPDIGVKLDKRFAKNIKGQEDKIAAIISGISGAEKKPNGIGDLVFQLMGKKEQELLLKQSAANIDYKNAAIEMLRLDQLRSDALSRQAYEAQNTRADTMSNVPTEKVEAFSPKEIAARVKALNVIINAATTSAEAKAKTEVEKKSIENGGGINVTPVTLDENTVKTVATPEVIKQMDTEKLIQGVEQKQKDVETVVVQLDGKAQKVSRTLATAYSATQQLKAQKLLLDLDANKPVSGYEMTTQKSILQQEAVTDFALRQIPNLEDYYRSQLDFTRKIDLKDIMNLSAGVQGELQKILKKNISLVNFDGMSTEEHNNTLLRMVNDTLDTATSTITSQTFRDIANQSDTLQGFKDGMSNLFQKKLGLNEQISKQIVDTFLQDKEIYIYNLYKNTKEMPFVNINLNGTIDLSTENRAAFADKEGKFNHLQRLKGPANDLYEKHGVVFANKYIDTKGKEVDPTQVFFDYNIDDKQKAYHDMMDKYIKIMDDKGYAYIGSIQEEGNKNIFVPKANVDAFFDDLMEVPLKIVDQLSPRGKEIYMSNEQARAKQRMWNETMLDKESTQDYLQDTGRNAFRFIAFKSPDYLGEFLYTHGFNDLNNKSIGATENNITGKPAMSVDGKVLGKGQYTRMQAGILYDPNILNAVKKFAENTQNEVYEGKTLKSVIDSSDLSSIDGMQNVMDFITNNKIIEGFFGDDSYKSSVNKLVKPENDTLEAIARAEHDKSVLEKNGIIVKEFTPGDAITVPTDKYAVQSRDEFLTPEDTKDEKIKFTRQILTNTISDETSQSYEQDQQHKIETYNLISDIQAKKLEIINNMLSSLGDHPVDFIEDFAQQFGIKYNDPNYQQYLNSKNIDNVINMITNTIQDEVITGTKLLGNKMILRVIPGASAFVDEKINNYIRSKFPQTDPASINGNFVVVSRETHGHLANKDGSISRQLLVRHPVADANGINYPYVIFDDQLPEIAGIHYDMQGGMYVAGGKLLNRIEGDHDADKGYIFYDSQLNPLREGFARINDESFKNEPIVNAKPVRAFTAKDPKEIFIEAGERKTESKMSIGSVDNSNAMSELFIDSGLINSKAALGGESAEEGLRKVSSKALKNAVDGGEVKMNEVKQNKQRFITASDADLLTIATPKNIEAKGIKNLGGITWNFYDKEGKIIQNKNGSDAIGGLFNLKEKALISSNVVINKIQNFLDNLTPTDYKIVDTAYTFKDNKGKEINKEGKRLLLSPEAGRNIQKLLDTYSVKNIEANFKKIQSFVGKSDYVETKEGDKVTTEKKNRQITRFEQQYKDIQPSVDFLKQLEADGVIKGENPLTIFVDKIGNNLTSFNDKMRQNAKVVLAAKQNQIFDNIKATVIPEKPISPENKAELVKIMSSLDRKNKISERLYINAYIEAHPEVTEAKLRNNEAFKKQMASVLASKQDSAKSDLQVFKMEHPEVDVDNFIIHNSDFSDIKMSNLSSANQKLINNEMTHQLTLGQYDNLSDVGVSKADIMALKRAEPGSEEQEGLLTRIITGHSDWKDDFKANPAKYAQAPVNMPPSVKEGIKNGIKPETYTETLKDIDSLPKEQATHTRTAISELDSNLFTNLNIKDSEMLHAIGLLLGIKDLQDVEATHQMLDASQNKDPMIVKADTNKPFEYETQWNDLNAQKEQASNVVSTTNLTLQLFDIMKEHRDDPYSPEAQAKMKAAMDSFHDIFASGKLKEANDKAYFNTNAPKQLKEAQQAMYNYLEQINATGNLPGIAGAVQDFLLKTYKSATLGFAAGRGINQGAQAGLLAVTNKIDQVLHSEYNTKNIAKLLETSEDKLPSAGRITSETGLGTREFGNDSNPFQKNMREQPELLKKLSYIPNKMMEVAAWGLEKTVGPIEQKFYETEFNRSMGEWIKTNGAEASTFLVKDNITPENRIRKEKLIQQWKREARESTKTAFFDYSNNPLIINKLETYVPFTNFMYNGIKIMQKYPMTFMFGAAVLNNLKYAYGDNVSYVDDEGQKIDAGMSLRIPILASLGLDSVALNMNHVLHVSPESIGMKPASWYNVITGREDPRFQKFYKSGSMADYLDLGLSMMAPPVARVVNALINFNSTKDLDGKKYNALAELNASMIYATTGAVVADKSTAKAWDLYIKKDYDNLLAMSPNQLNRFLQEDSIVKKGITLQSIKALKRASDLGVFSSFNDPYQEAMVTLGALPLHDSIGTKERLESDGKLIMNLTETALGKNFSGAESENFKDTLEKWKQMYKDPSFKEFEKVVPGMGKAIRHFVENEDYYTSRNEAYEMIKSNDKETAIKGELRLIALQYKFEGDEGMSINEKVSAMQYGKMNKPLFYGSSKDGIPAHSLQMTDAYKASLQYKGDLVYNYMEKTNSIAGLNSLRKAFVTMAYASSKEADKNKYFALAKDAYNQSLKAEHEMKVMCSPEYALFQLSGDYKAFQKYQATKTDGKDYSLNTGWASKFEKNRETYGESTKKEREDHINKLIELSNRLNSDEKTFMKESMGTDIKANVDYFNKIRGDSSAIQDIQTLKDLLNK